MKKETKITKTIATLLTHLNIDLSQDGLAETPQRVARMYAELLEGYTQEPSQIFKTFEENSCNELIIVADIPFYSLCEHHLIPFFGKVSIGYIPNKRILGLSKFARLVNIYAKRLQVQERLTQQIADDIQTYLKPEGVIVFIDAEHLCMSMRGVNKPGSLTKTFATKGKCMEDRSYLQYFLLQIKK